MPYMPASAGEGEIILTIEGTGKAGCMLFEMHVAIVPLASVRNSLTCPPDQPVPAMPPPALRVYSQQKEYHSASDKYLLEGRILETHSRNGQVAYDMLVKVEVDQASLRAVRAQERKSHAHHKYYTLTHIYTQTDRQTDRLTD